MTSRFQVVPAAYLILQRGEESDREVLLQYRRGTGYRDEHWACAAAGHVEAGESVLAAAVREAREELGVTVAPNDLEPLTAMHRTHGNHREIDERVDFFFACRRWSGTPRTMEPAKSAGLQWFRLDALPAPVVPHEACVLRALRDGSTAAIQTYGFDRQDHR
ncbi:NUDIX hydrolase [Ruania halotolerans]|uniref:NUDIX hydrolase n=1 Tax=Ruania halotolerans TaxID=2897773 RepID=UPI001E2F688C|nr:NUDIX domain-containing protein [Ruania halotolerans]UFU06821.1 NUDIX domain-containing protein [Ruania halotolerans]